MGAIDYNPTYHRWSNNNNYICILTVESELITPVACNLHISVRWIWHSCRGQHTHIDVLCIVAVIISSKSPHLFQTRYIILINLKSTDLCSEQIIGWQTSLKWMFVHLSWYIYIYIQNVHFTVHGFQSVKPRNAVNHRGWYTAQLTELPWNLSCAKVMLFVVVLYSHSTHTESAHKTYTFKYNAKRVKIGQNRWRLIQKLKFRPYFIWYYDFIPIEVWENHNDTCHIWCNTLDIRCWIYRGLHAAVTQNSLKSCTLNIFWKFWIDFFC